MFSDAAKKQIDACRFCWMCRHVCPVGLATGKEADTPRGRAVLCKYVLTGMDIKKEIAGDMFACCLCNACAEWCETGFQPSVFIREARTEALVSGCLPPEVEKIALAALKSGSIYPETKSELPQKFPERADVLLVLGETARIKQPAIAEAACSLLKKAGISYAVLRDEPPTGAMLFDLVGEIQEVRDVAEKFLNRAVETGAQTIVCVDPSDVRFFKQECARWGLPLPRDVFSITAYLSDLLESKKLRISRKWNGVVTFHDPCRLARDLEETEPCRKLLAAAGAQLKEMYLNRENTRCCGGEVLNSHSPKITGKIAQTRIDDARRTGAELCVTACPGCSQVLGTVGGDYIKNILVLLNECC